MPLIAKLDLSLRRYLEQHLDERRFKCDGKPLPSPFQV